MKRIIDYTTKRKKGWNPFVFKAIKVERSHRDDEKYYITEKYLPVKKN